MKIATFNINGIRARVDSLLAWLEAAAPDVVALQEIKAQDADFPRDLFTARGYQVETHGQKGFNGVALLSRRPLLNITRGLPGDETDEQARFIAADVAGEKGMLRLCGLYLPNGNPAPGPKYDYKLAWMARLEAEARALLVAEQPFALLGDFNVIPRAEDAAKPEAWREDALFRPETRVAYQRLTNLGLSDALRLSAPPPGPYTFWDFQAGAWERNNGIRIDHILLSPAAADRLTKAGVDREERAGPRPSDHVPVWAHLDF